MDDYVVYYTCIMYIYMERDRDYLGKLDMWVYMYVSWHDVCIYLYIYTLFFRILRSRGGAVYVIGRCVCVCGGVR